MTWHPSIGPCYVRLVFWKRTQEFTHNRALTCRKTPWSLGPILQITGYVNRLSVGRHISRVGFSYFSWVSLVRHYISVFLVCTFVYIGPKLLCFSLALFLVLRYFILCLSCLLLVCLFLPSPPSLFTSHLFSAVVLSSTGRKNMK